MASSMTCRRSLLTPFNNRLLFPMSQRLNDVTRSETSLPLAQRTATPHAQPKLGPSAARECETNPCTASKRAPYSIPRTYRWTSPGVLGRAVLNAGDCIQVGWLLGANPQRLPTERLSLANTKNSTGKCAGHYKCKGLASLLLALLETASAKSELTAAMQ